MVRILDVTFPNKSALKKVTLFPLFNPKATKKKLEERIQQKIGAILVEKTLQIYSEKKTT